MYREEEITDRDLELTVPDLRIPEAGDVRKVVEAIIEQDGHVYMWTPEGEGLSIAETLPPVYPLAAFEKSALITALLQNGYLLPSEVVSLKVSIFDDPNRGVLNFKTLEQLLREIEDSVVEIELEPFSERELEESLFPPSTIVSRSVDLEHEAPMLRDMQLGVVGLLNQMQHKGILSENERQQILSADVEKFVDLTQNLEEEYEQISEVLPLKNVSSKLSFFSKRIMGVGSRYGHNWEEQDSTTIADLKQRIHDMQTLAVSINVDGTRECRRKLLELSKGCQKLGADVNSFECDLVYRREYQDFLSYGVTI